MGKNWKQQKPMSRIGPTTNLQMTWNASNNPGNGPSFTQQKAEVQAKANENNIYNIYIKLAENVEGAAELVTPQKGSKRPTLGHLPRTATYCQQVSGHLQPRLKVAWPHRSNIASTPSFALSGPSPSDQPWSAYQRTDLGSARTGFCSTNHLECWRFSQKARNQHNFSTLNCVIFLQSWADSCAIIWGIHEHFVSEVSLSSKIHSFIIFHKWCR